MSNNSSERRGRWRCVLRRDLLALGLAAAAAGCTRDQWQRLPSPDDAVAAFSWFSTMPKGLAIQPYQMPRAPVPGTVPVTGAEAPSVPWTPQNAAAVDRMKNPAARTSESINRGKNRFEIYCQPCHGPAGDGKGPVASKLGSVRDLTSPQVRAYTDGRLYAAIRHGFGLMPAYGDKVRGEDRWNIVNYVRVLQGGSQ